MLTGSEKAMTPYSSTLAWKIPWTEEPGRLQSMGSLRVRHDWATSLSRIGEGNGNPLQCSCLENPRDGGAWWAAVYGVAQSPTRLKRLSSSSSICLQSSVYFLLVNVLLQLCSWLIHGHQVDFSEEYYLSDQAKLALNEMLFWSWQMALKSKF